MEIPKIIHCCWFGKNDFPPLVLKCVESWKKYLPDYEIRIWNEDNFDVESVYFTKEAYKSGNWAFVSDYVRLYALCNFGGVYMDVDVEVVKDFTPVLEGKSYVTSFTEGDLVTAGFFACVPNHPFIKSVLEFYDKTYTGGEIRYVSNPYVFTRVADKLYSIREKGAPQDAPDFTVYPMDRFMPFKKNVFGDGAFRITENTYTVHHGLNSSSRRKKPLKTLLGVARLLIPTKLFLYLKKLHVKRIYKSLFK